MHVQVAFLSVNDTFCPKHTYSHLHTQLYKKTMLYESCCGWPTCYVHRAWLLTLYYRAIGLRLVRPRWFTVWLCDASNEMWNREKEKRIIPSYIMRPLYFFFRRSVKSLGQYGPDKSLQAHHWVEYVVAIGYRWSQTKRLLLAFGFVGNSSFSSQVKRSGENYDYAEMSRCG